MKDSTLLILCLISFLTGFGLSELISSNHNSENQNKINELMRTDSLRADSLFWLKKSEIELQKELQAQDSMISLQQFQLSTLQNSHAKKTVHILSLPLDSAVELLSENLGN